MPRANPLFAQHPTIHRWDKIWIGLILGLSVPLLGIGIVYLISLISHYTEGGEVATVRDLLRMIHSVDSLSRFMSVGCILNLGVFYLAINRDRFNIARGIIFATIIVALPVVFNVVKDWFA